MFTYQTVHVIWLWSCDAVTNVNSCNIHFELASVFYVKCSSPCILHKFSLFLNKFYPIQVHNIWVNILALIGWFVLNSVFKWVCGTVYYFFYRQTVQVCSTPFLYFKTVTVYTFFASNLSTVLPLFLKECNILENICGIFG